MVDRVMHTMTNEGRESGRVGRARAVAAIRFAPDGARDKGIGLSSGWEH